MLGQEVTVCPSITPASISVHGPWQIAAIGRPVAANDLQELHDRAVGPELIGVGDAAGEHHAVEVLGLCLDRGAIAPGTCRPCRDG